MNASSTTKLTLPYLQPGQALKTITHNEAIKRLDAGLYLSCSNMSADALPESPTEGQTLVLGNVSDGEYAIRTGQIAVFYNGDWVWFSPKAGWVIWDETTRTLRVYDGIKWAAPASNQIPQIGINTSSSESQRLAVASETSLFSHDGHSHRMTVNRATEADVSSVIFQTDYAGEAEIGLTGPKGFSIKTSADGTDWSERLTTPDDYVGIRAPAFGSVRIPISNNSAEFITTPATGGIFAITTVSDGAFPRVTHSGIFAYDTGDSPDLVVLAKTNRVDIHNQAILDGTMSTDGNIGISAVNGGLYFENRINMKRILSLTFLC